MNPDQNQPQEQPQEPTQVPVTELPVDAGQSIEVTTSSAEMPAETPAPYAEAPVVEPVAEATPVETPTSNPFGGGDVPVNSDQATPNPFGAAPVASDATMTTAAVPATDPLATPPKKSKKKLIILLSAVIGGLIILGGAALAVYIMFFAVSKADYQKAFDQVSIVRDKYSTGSNISSNSSDETIAATKAALAEFKTENAKLADLKAFKSDKDLKEKYDVYKPKADKFVEFGETFVPSLARFLDAQTQISAIGTSTTRVTVPANVQKTITILDGLSDIADPSLKAYLDVEVAAYKEILPNATIYSTPSSTTSQKSKALLAISDSLGKLSKASTILSTDLKAKTTAVSLTDALNDLGKAVTAKLNAAK